MDRMGRVGVFGGGVEEGAATDGGISAIAGAGFIVMASGPKASLASLAGYATLGGVFFLISAIRLQRGVGTAAR